MVAALECACVYNALINMRTAALRRPDHQVLRWLFFVGVTTILSPGNVHAQPLAQILSPQPGTRIRLKESIPVSAEARGNNVTWRLFLRVGETDQSEIAAGAGEIHGTEIARLEPLRAWVGKPAQLTLSVSDGAMAVEATSSFKVIEGEFSLIPLHPGNFATAGYGYYVYTVDGAGEKVLYSSGEESPAPMTIIHRSTGQRDVIRIDLGATSGVKFSGDGNRLFYDGRFGSSAFGLGFSDVDTLGGQLIDEIATFFFSVDAAGQRVAFQHAVPSGDSEYYEFIFADLAADEWQRITDDPAAISYTAEHLRMSASTPVISDDGSTVVFLSEATLGVGADDPAIGARVFAYDTMTQTLRQAATIPSNWVSIGLPTLSADGRWLSFSGRRTTSAWPSAVLVDVETGDLMAPAFNVGDYVVFDARVTRDGNGIVLSTTADLDANLGNDDHNLELFYYDRRSGDFTQMSDTVGGVGYPGGGCPNYEPSISDDGSVALFAFQKFSGEGCGVAGPQRDARDGLSFGFTRAIRKRTGNAEVVLEGVSTQRVTAGSVLRMDFTASDADGDPISFFAQRKGALDVPRGSIFTDHHDGTATFEWRTRPADVGDNVVTVAAFDEGGGEMSQDIVIAIGPDTSTCIGACGGGEVVTITDILTMVNIALGTTSLQACTAGDADADGAITIDEILRAVTNALAACGS